MGASPLAACCCCCWYCCGQQIVVEEVEEKGVVLAWVAAGQRYHLLCLAHQNCCCYGCCQCLPWTARGAGVAGQGMAGAVLFLQLLQLLRPCLLGVTASIPEAGAGEEVGALHGADPWLWCTPGSLAGRPVLGGVLGVQDAAAWAVGCRTQCAGPVLACLLQQQLS